MCGIQEFNCISYFASLVLALLLNTSRSYILLRIICLVSTVYKYAKNPSLRKICEQVKRR
jgi:hypothetical protein